MSTRLGRAGISRMLAIAVVIDAAYWILWFTSRSTVASDTRPAYVEFENAFPLADAWLGFACLAGLMAILRRSPVALLWLIAAGGAGIYLFGMDVLYDLENGIYGKGSGGLIEAAINVITLAFALVAMAWAWRNRADLLDPRSGPGGPETV